MMQPLFWVAFAVGLTVLAWVGVGYLGSHALALAITVVIAAFFLLGTYELWREHGRIKALRRVLAGLKLPPVGLDVWLLGLPAEWRAAIAARIEGTRVALPGPALAPYLTGLLVLIGMSGTFLGMVATLRGTGQALAGAAGVEAIREALLGPVAGLGLAFGTSVAGIVCSAMLGLMTALNRAERGALVQQLDALIAGPLNGFSAGERQAQVLADMTRHLERQANLLPTVVERLQETLGALERRHEDLAGRLAADQTRFHETTAEGQRALAASLRETLSQGVAQGVAQGAGVVRDALAPAVAQTLDGLGRENAAMRVAVAEQVGRQLSGMGEQADALAETLGAHLREQSARLAERWDAALAAPLAQFEALGVRQDAWLEKSGAELSRHAAELTAAVEAGRQRADERLQAQEAARERSWQAGLDGLASKLAEQWQQAGDANRARIEGIVAGFEAGNERIQAALGAQGTDILGRLGALVEKAGEGPQAAATLVAALEERVRDTTSRQDDWLQTSAANLDRHAAALHATIDAAQARLDERAQAQDAAREQRWQTALDGLATKLAEQWQATGDTHRERIDGIVAGFEAGNQRIQAALGAQGTDILARLGALVEKAGEGPQAAAALVVALEERVHDTTSRQDEWLQASIANLDRHAAELQATVTAAQGRLDERFQAQEAGREQAWQAALDGLATKLANQWEEAADASQTRIEAIVASFEAGQQRIQAAVGSQGADTLARLGELVAQAGEGPKAAAALVSALEDRVRETAARDDALLEERHRLIAAGQQLIEGWTEAQKAQRADLEALLESGTARMAEMSRRVAEAFDQQSTRVDGASAQLMRSAVEIASLGEAFGAAVQIYGQSNQQLLSQLAHIESALGRALSRSDEQLDYYVAQAREVVELSVGAQKQIIEDLHGLAERRERPAGEDNNDRQAA